MGRNRLWLALVLVMCTACGEDRITDTGRPAIQRQASHVKASNYDLVTRALARAMERQEVRDAVKNAMRASPVTEHKLVFSISSPLLKAARY